MEMGASATCGHRVARFMAPTNSVLIVALGTGLVVAACGNIAHCHGHLHIARSPSAAVLPRCHVCSLPHAASSSSLLQFCLNYFACLFMVESLISSLVSLATLTTTTSTTVVLLQPRLLLLATSAPAVAPCVDTI